MSWGQQQQQQQQQQQYHQEFKKRSEDDEDTLSLDSEKSQGFINEQVNSWPAWSVGNQNANQPHHNPFMRYQVNSYPQYQQPLGFAPPVTNPNYSNSQNPFTQAQQPVKTPQIPTYFSRGPVYVPEQFQPQQVNAPIQPIQLKPKAKKH